MKKSHTPKINSTNETKANKSNANDRINNMKITMENP